MKNYLILWAVAAMCGALLSCSSTSEENIEGEKKLVNMVSDPEPITLSAEQQVFVNDNNIFTLNFLKTVNGKDTSGKSFIYSPLSITYVLGMVNDAATGTTEKELEETLGFHTGGIKAVNDYCKKLIDGLPKVDKDVTLNIANAIFLNKDYTLKEQFQKDMNTYYDAKAEALDFKASGTLGHINGWCNDKTKGMIPKILNEVSPYVVSYLLNAIYFKADWTSKFDKKNTKTEKFTTVSGTVDMPMMHQDVLIRYMKNDTYAAVNMPYGNGYWSMVVMLPEEGKTVDDIMAQLATKGLEGFDYTIDEGSYYSTYEVDLKLPRYETDADTDDLGEGGLIDVLKAMGIQLAFDSNFAEIPNMCNKPVYIDMMRQKAKIKVNEEGSEAAAVTIAAMNECTSVGPVTTPKATFHANRPFVYVIREASSGVILFVGKFVG